MLPRLSKIHEEMDNNCEIIYFFVEIDRDIKYAVVRRCDRLWWPREIKTGSTGV